MKFELETRCFNKALEKCAKVIDKKSTLEITKNINFYISNGLCKITSTDMERFLEIEIPVDTGNIDKDFNFTLMETEVLLKAIKYFKDNIVKLDIDMDKLLLHIECGNKKAVISIYSEENTYPAVPKVNGQDCKRYKYNAKTLSSRYDLVKHCICKDFNRPIYTGIHFENSDIVALDGYRVAINTDEQLVVDMPFTVPNNTIKDIKKLFDTQICIDVDDKYIVISEDINGNKTTLTSRLLAGEYFKYSQCFPETKYESDIDTKSFIESLKYCNEFIKDKKHNGVLFYNGELTTLESKGSIKTKVDVENMDILIGFNCQYMIEMLSVYEDTVHMSMKNSNYSIVFTDNKCNKSLLLPVRTSGEMVKYFD